MKKYRLPNGEILKRYWTYRHNETVTIKEMYTGYSISTAQTTMILKHYRVHNPWYYRLLGIIPKLKKICQK